jgi:hypothetical protein
VVTVLFVEPESRLESDTGVERCEEILDDIVCIQTEIGCFYPIDLDIELWIVVLLLNPHIHRAGGFFDGLFYLERNHLCC